MPKMTQKIVPLKINNQSEKKLKLILDRECVFFIIQWINVDPMLIHHWICKFYNQNFQRCFIADLTSCDVSTEYKIYSFNFIL